MNYIELSFRLEQPLVQAELIMAVLGEAGFESFETTDWGILAYVAEAAYDADAIKEMLDMLDFKTQYSEKLIETVNWNAVWESSFEPVIIDNRCLIRAPFHPSNNNYELEIVIEPKMSFGTAHHETTALMISWLLDEQLDEKSVMDMGCGTGILAILAKKRGSAYTKGIDNDEWAYQNSLENIQLNNTPDITVELGDAELLKNEQTYDVIIANINRNILLKDMASYATIAHTGSHLFLSGFYEEDIEAITSRAGSFGFQLKGARSRNNWVALSFEKE